MDLLTLIMACSLYTKNEITQAMLEVGSKHSPNLVTVYRPELPGGTAVTFSQPAEAARYAQLAMDQGYTVEFGLMQIPSHWLKKYHDTLVLKDVFKPCKNVVVATDILNRATDYCRRHHYPYRRCALSVYKTGDMNSDAGLLYANTVLRIARSHDPTLSIQEMALSLPKPDFGSEDTHD